MKLGTSLPSLVGATDWVNGSVTQDELIGGPLLIHFWAVSCYVCKDNLPQLREWKKLYPKLSFIAVHMPRQEEDTVRDAVDAAIRDFHITEPCAIDNNHAIKDAFENAEAWVPAYFLFDHEGKLKMRSAGANGLALLKSAVERIAA